MTLLVCPHRTDPLVTVQRKQTKRTTEHFEILKDALLQLDKPIIKISDQIGAFNDHLDSEFCLPLVLQSIMLRPYQEKSVKEYFAGCPKLIIEAIMMISQRAYCLNLASGYSRARISLNGDSRAYPLYFGFMDYVSNLPKLGFDICLTQTQLVQGKPDLRQSFITLDFEHRRFLLGGL